MFLEYDADGSGFLEEAEIKEALGQLKPKATKAAISMVYGLLMTYGDKNGDGKLDSGEFINAYNKVARPPKFCRPGPRGLRRPETQPPRAAPARAPTPQPRPLPRAARPAPTPPRPVAAPCSSSRCSTSWATATSCPTRRS